MMFKCPKCTHSIEMDDVHYCPKCGLDFVQLRAQLIEKFSPRKKRYYTILLSSATLISLIGVLVSFLFHQYYVYILFAMISWYIVVFLNRHIGLIDMSNIESSIKKYLKGMSIIVLIINVLNIITFVQTVIALL